MQIGAVFPQLEIGPDVGAVRAYAQAVQDLGFGHILVYDHVLGADPQVHRGWNSVYDVRDMFHEPMVLFGFLAALTSVELVPGVLVLPQRQTALVAKQAAEVDLLTGGRFRLGVGIGWNQVEFEALGEEFSLRARRFEEQVEVLRLLWTRESVTYEGHFHRITGAGLAPVPVQRPIPLWIGGSSAPAYRRMGRLADGWFPMPEEPGEEFHAAQEIIAASAVEAGRDPATIGIEARVPWDRDPDRVAARVEAWRAAGATHVSINTLYRDLATADEHIAALSTAARALQLSA